MKEKLKHFQEPLTNELLDYLVRDDHFHFSITLQVWNLTFRWLLLVCYLKLLKFPFVSMLRLTLSFKLNRFVMFSVFVQQRHDFRTRFIWPYEQVQALKVSCVFQVV